MSANAVTQRVARKELGLFFASPVAWLFLSSFAVSTLFIFFWVESFFARNIADLRPLFEWLPLLLIFLCAALTMRMWSDERRNGTLEHVLTQPASLGRFVVGKFYACFTLLLLALLTTLPLPVTVSLLGELDWGPVAAGYLASALLGAAYLSIGLFVSSRTDNPIVSLMGTVALCGLLYLLGNASFTGFFDNHTGQILRLIGSGSRFDSIIRGVVDVRDLAYYSSLIVGFLALNMYTLERERWAREASTQRHRLWRWAIVLLLLNLVASNIWLHRLHSLRVDITQGRHYSLSSVTHSVLGQLQEPLLLRGYFSAKTHPLLAPLVDQLHDLLREYEIAGEGKLRVEWIDPEDRPELEQEANQHYGIKATPFQVADRHRSALSNSYFNLLVRYGDEFQTLAYTDLIEVLGTNANSQAPEVRLRNPEFDITRAIRDTLYAYRSGGELLDEIDSSVEFIGYVSSDERLPDALKAYRKQIESSLRDVAQRSEGRFSLRFIDPQAGGDALVQQIAQRWGFTPMVAKLGDEQPFFFYLTLADENQVVQIPTGNFDARQFEPALNAALQRFTRGMTRTVALALPASHPEMARFQLGGPTFDNLERAIGRNYDLLLEELNDGSVSATADILLVMAPQHLAEPAIFAIDQYLMRGGTVVLATSPFTTELAGSELRLQDWNSGLEDWLDHLGVSIADAMVLDSKHATFPAPVLRRSGEYEFRDMQMIDYPFFIDLRQTGLARDHPVTAGLPQLTMPWASPIELQPREGRRSHYLLRSSPDSWLSEGTDIMPRLEAGGGFSPQDSTQAHTLGVLLQGRFDSWFTETPAISAAAMDEAAPATALLRHSPESARLVIYASNDFLDDQVLAAVARGTGSSYLGAIELLLATVDWALQDEQLMQIRSRAHFNRTLAPMTSQQQQSLEYLNYGLAMAWLLLLGLLYHLRRVLVRRRYARELAL